MARKATRYITKDQAAEKLVDAIKALRAVHSDEWFVQMLVIANMCFEHLEHNISKVNPDNEQIDKALNDALCDFGNLYQHDWMARAARMMILCDMSHRMRTSPRKRDRSERVQSRCESAH